MPVSQEVHFAHHLAANEKVTRDRALRKLTRWIRAKSGRQDTVFTEESLMKLWKGLFFCMWMSDKPFVQQELASSIAGLVHCFAHQDQSLLFLDTFFKTMAHEWFAIDRFRLEKFMMLVRRCFRQGVVLAYSGGWKNENITKFCNTLKTTALCPNSQEIPLGLRLHVVDVFLQELARAHGGELTPEQAMLFLQPFLEILTQSNEQTLVDAVCKNVFFLLLDLDREAAELGVDPTIVKLKGCREADSDDSEQEEEDEDMYDEHGRVLEKGESSQDLPAVPFDYSMIADKLFNTLKASTLKPLNRAVITRMVKKFRAVIKEGLVRPPVEEVDVGDAITEDDIEAAANKLEEELEEELEEDREEVVRLRKEREKTKPSFGFDSTSGAYEFIFNGDNSDGDQELGDEADNRKKHLKAQRLKKQSEELGSDQEETDTGSEFENSSGEDEGILQVKSLRKNHKKSSSPLQERNKKSVEDDDKMLDVNGANRRRKQRSSAQDDEKVKNNKNALQEVAESCAPPSQKKRRKRKRKASQSSSVDEAKSPEEKKLKNCGKQVSEFNKSTGFSECESQKTASPVEGVSPLKETKKTVFLAKKADRLVLGKVPRKKSLNVKSNVKSPSTPAQQQSLKPVGSQKSPIDGQAQISLEEKKQKYSTGLVQQQSPKPAQKLPVTKKKISENGQSPTSGQARVSLEQKQQKLLGRRQARKEKKQRRLSAETKGWQVTPLKPGLGEAKQTSMPATPASGVACAGESPKGTEKAPGLQLSPVDKPGSLPLKKRLSIGGARSPSMGAVKEESEGMKAVEVACVKFPQSPLRNTVHPNGEQSVKILPVKLPHTPKAKQPAAYFLRKCVSATKAELSKSRKFSSPPVKPSPSSQEEKRVIFALSKNKAQDPREYFEILKNSPEIPFDASKRPVQGVLKARLSLSSNAPASSCSKKRSRASDFF